MTEQPIKTAKIQLVVTFAPVLFQLQAPDKVLRYDGADHEFFCDYDHSYDSQAANWFEEQVKQLFGNVLAV
jgi:dienelactone hydrolase